MASRQDENGLGQEKLEREKTEDGGTHWNCVVEGRSFVASGPIKSRGSRDGFALSRPLATLPGAGAGKNLVVPRHSRGANSDPNANPLSSAALVDLPADLLRNWRVNIQKKNFYVKRRSAFDNIFSN
jgi:hypothetical protein